MSGCGIRDTQLLTHLPIPIMSRLIKSCLSPDTLILLLCSEVNSRFFLSTSLALQSGGLELVAELLLTVMVGSLPTFRPNTYPLH